MHSLLLEPFDYLAAELVDSEDSGRLPPTAALPSTRFALRCQVIGVFSWPPGVCGS